MFNAMDCWVNCSLIFDNNSISEFEETQAKGDVSQNWWAIGGWTNFMVSLILNFWFKVDVPFAHVFNTPLTHPHEIND
jgi:hypothetical protein